MENLILPTKEEIYMDCPQYTALHECKIFAEYTDNLYLLLREDFISTLRTHFKNIEGPCCESDDFYYEENVSIELSSYGPNRVLNLHRSIQDNQR